MNLSQFTLQRTCPKCGEQFKVEPDDIFWDDHGYGYSTKLCKCKHCNAINVIKHEEDYGLSKLNTDKRLF